MNALDMAKRAYGSPSAPIRTDRGTEYALFSQITRRIRDAALKGPAGFPALAAAVHDNRRLWTTLAADVSDADNSLPDDLKARIFYLSEFTNNHSRKVLRGQASVAPLIEVNAAVMRGLGAGGIAA